MSKKAFASNSEELQRRLKQERQKYDETVAELKIQIPSLEQRLEK
jgi:hypothetical protein